MHYALLLTTAFLVADADFVVRDITYKQPEFDSIADVLHILQKSGTIEFSGNMPRTARIEIERFKKGEKVPRPLQSIGVMAGAIEEGSDRIRFAVNFLDTDFLTLGDGKKGHCRLVFKLNVGAVTGTGTLDVPKEEGDFSKMTSGGNFGPKASIKDRIPLFFMIDGRTGSVSSGATPEEVVENNPNADVAIVYMRLSD